MLFSAAAKDTRLIYCALQQFFHLLIAICLCECLFYGHCIKKINIIVFILRVLCKNEAIRTSLLEENRLSVIILPIRLLVVAIQQAEIDGSHIIIDS